MKRLNIIAMVLLLIAVFALPYGFYTFLRITITTIAVINMLKFHYTKDESLMIAMGGIAILFNPIVPIYLNKSIWTVIDVICIILFYWAYKKYR